MLWILIKNCLTRKVEAQREHVLEGKGLFINYVIYFWILIKNCLTRKVEAQLEHELGGMVYSLIQKGDGVHLGVVCCVFRPAFGWCAHLKAGQNT